MPENSETANAVLVRKPSGYYLLVTCYLSKAHFKQEPLGGAVGIEFGMDTKITLSNGSKIDFELHETHRLKKIQRKWAKARKGSRKEIRMHDDKDIEAREARYGEKMIEIKVRFFTNGIAPKEGEIIPKHAWAWGVVRVRRNESHGIKPGKAKIFNSLLDLSATIEKVLIEHGIVLHPDVKMRKYFFGG